MSWYLKVLKNYTGFSGRARRTEYWMFALFNMIIAIALLVGLGVIAPEIGSMAYAIYILAVFLPSLAVTIRRLHDTNKSGWMCLVSLIPLIGAIWILVLMCMDGTSGPNDYGDDPKAA